MFCVSIPTDILRYKLFIFLGYVDFTRTSGVCREMQRHWKYAQSKLLPLDSVRVLPGELDAMMLKVDRSRKLTTLVLGEGTYKLHSTIYNHNIIGSGGRRTIVRSWHTGFVVIGDCRIHGIVLTPPTIINIGSSFTVNGIKSEKMPYTWRHHYTQHLTSRHLHALYQREHTYQTLVSGMKMCDLKERERILKWREKPSPYFHHHPPEHYIWENLKMRFRDIPPHVFDISKYRKSNNEMSVDTFPHRPFIDELRTRRQRLKRTCSDRPTSMPKRTCLDRPKPPAKPSSNTEFAVLTLGLGLGLSALTTWLCK